MHDEEETPAPDPRLPGLGRQVGAVAVALLLLAGVVGVSRVVADLGGTTASGEAVQVSGSPAPPTRLVLPSLGVRASVVPIEMDQKGVLTPPADVDSVGWWQRSAEPGARSGKVLITGHTVRIGDGALDEIGSLEPGDDVVLRSPGGETRFRTTEVRTLTQEQVAARAKKLFGQEDGSGGLVLVTCTDWDGTAWRSNIVVSAEPVV
ncbi:class F sortase [Nocardioides seonyuensis]|uniref:Class F sortase n=1 Tax=Nocardioides seonyuensis TaxID=2518371 RepID=A0A4P7IDA5_9ACTN|nr:class F sortase [Nocardioides seonyuensis]QBX54650.1 class F sortase [Nocardioides seonyuensis]